jgi:glycosyltransferase involved in cell wall biosynthesis
MRIIHVTNYEIPGFGYEELYLARAQKALGHEVMIITSNYLHPEGFYAVLSQRFPQRQIAPCDGESEGVRILRLSTREIGGRVWLSGLERHIAQIRPDVVHCHNVLQFYTVRMALMKAIGRQDFALVVDEHTQTSVMRKSMGGKLFYRMYGILAQPVIGHYVAHYSAKNDDGKRYMESACGIRGPIEVITLGVDTDKFVASNVRRHEWRRLLGVPHESLLFLYTGKLIPAKGLHLLIGAAIELLKNGADIHVAFVGDAESAYLDALRNRVIQAGLEKRFHFKPGVPPSQMPSVYAAGDIGVWPGVESTAILEALSSSLPVITVSSSSWTPLVDQGVGLVFDPGDEKSLANAMLVLTDSPRRKAMGALGRQIVSRSYSWRQCAEQYLDAYQRSLKAPVPA